MRVRRSLQADVRDAPDLPLALGRPGSAAQDAKYGDSGHATRWVALVDGWYPKSGLYSLNARAQWAVRGRLVAAAKQRVGMALLLGRWPLTALSGRRWIVTMTVMQRRGGPPDGDNLQGSLKCVRDACATWLGVDDGSDLVEWHYGWERGLDGVLIVLEEMLH